MHSKILEIPGKFVWLDIVQPERQELEEIAHQYGLHATSLADCLDPFHLPKSEQIGDVNFVITRAYDDRCSASCDTVQELTRKVAIFMGRNFLITVHRAELPFLTELRDHYRNSEGPASGMTITWDILRRSARSFERPMEAVLAELEKLETDIFTHTDDNRLHIEAMYFIKRKASVFKRIFRLTIDVLEHYHAFSYIEAPLLQDVQELAKRLFFMADEMVENSNSLLNHYLSLSAHRTNEIIRVLTVFSAFFLPLTFLAGIYGMNFQHMPELTSPYGYPLALSGMVVVCAGIYFWFKRRKWI